MQAHLLSKKASLAQQCAYCPLPSEEKHSASKHPTEPVRNPGNLANPGVSSSRCLAHDGQHMAWNHISPAFREPHRPHIHSLSWGLRLDSICPAKPTLSQRNHSGLRTLKWAYFACREAHQLLSGQARWATSHRGDLTGTAWKAPTCRLGDLAGGDLLPLGANLPSMQQSSMFCHHEGELPCLQGNRPGPGPGSSAPRAPALHLCYIHSTLPGIHQAALPSQCHAQETA